MRSFRPATISDVAQAAGVSIRTVSRVLNASPKVGAASRERVEAAISALSFHPSSRARGLASGRSSLIGVIQGDPNAHVIGVLQRGIVEVCADRGYELVVHHSGFHATSLVADLEAFAVRSRIDGVIVLPPLSELAAVPATLGEFGVPTVGIAAVRVPDFAGAIVTEERAAAAMLAERLVALGHRRLAIITGPSAFYSASEREGGFRSVLDAHGIELPNAYVAEGDYGFSTAYACAGELLSLPTPPTAIVAGNDISAAAVLKVAAERGVRVPADLSVAGFDDSDIASMISPALTTIRRPLAAIAREATVRLIAMIDDPGLRRLPDHRVALTLVERQSTGPAPAARS